MPPLPLNLKEIGDARSQLARQRQTEREAVAGHQRAKSTLDTLLRSGAGGREIAAAQANVERLAQAARSSAAASREWLQTIGSLSNGLIGRRDPSAMVSALATTHPIALFPVSIQTRYDDATTK